MTRREIFKLDKIWSDLVKYQAEYQCEHCKIKGTRMEAAHVVGRRHRATRWGAYFPKLGEPGWEYYDLCGHCLCHNCHQQYDEHGPLEHDITERTVGLDRKIRIQAYATQTIAMYQDFKDIKKILEGKR